MNFPAWEDGLAIGDDVEAYWESELEGKAWHPARVHKVYKESYEVEWAAEPNVFDKVPAKHVRPLESVVEGADQVSEVSGSIKTEGLEESHKALAAWDARGVNTCSYYISVVHDARRWRVLRRRASALANAP